MHAGVSVNVVNDELLVEPLTGMPIINGQPVEVKLYFALVAVEARLEYYTGKTAGTLGMGKKMMNSL